MSNNDREPRNPWLVAAVQGAGWLGLFGAGAYVMPQMLSGEIKPADIIAEVPHWRDMLLDAVPAVLGSVAVAVVVVLAAVLLVRHGAALLNVAHNTKRRYTRHWARVMADQGLTTQKQGRTEVPLLRAVAAGTDTDVLTVTLLPGQSPVEWHRRADQLAIAFGRNTGEIRTKGTGAEIDLVLSSHGGGLPRKALTESKPPTIVIPPLQRDHPKKELVATVTGMTIQIGWARVQLHTRTGQFVSARNHWGIRGRWGRWTVPAIAA